MGLRHYILKRLLILIPTFFIISLLTFVVVRVVPVDPLVVWVGPHARPEQIQKARVELGLDRSWLEQYFGYIVGIFHGDFGVSFRSHRPVIMDIMIFLPSTLELVITGMIIGSAVGLPLGVISAKKRNRIEDHLSRLFAVGGVSLPTFWISLVLQILFFKYSGILPAWGRLSQYVEVNYPVTCITGFLLIDSLITGNFVAFQDAAAHIILPGLVMALYPIGLVARMTRACMLEVLEEDYIVAARAYGIPEKVVTYVYALKNAVIPSLTALVLSFGYSLTGAFLVELIFDWRGLGWYASKAILSNDYAAIQGVTLLVALFYVLANLVADVIQARLDPRIILR